MRTLPRSQILNQFGNNIGDEGVRILAELLKQNTTLTQLDLSWNRICPEVTCALARSLAMDTTLTELNLLYNIISAEGASALAESLKQNTTLTQLNLKNNQIGAEGARALAESLKQNTALTQLNLENNQIGANGARALADSLKQNTTLTQLNLYRNNISTQSACALAESLKQNTTLTQLDLGDNEIGAEGARALAESLKQNTTLTELNLYNNQIGAEGVRALAGSLKQNTALTRLNLENNQIGADGACALADSLKQNTTLTQLNLYRNNISTQARALAESLKQNITLTQLNLGDNKIGAEGARALAESLKQNTTLALLNLERNIISNEGACVLVESLKQNTTLTQLDLENNSISDEGACTLAMSLKQITTLTHLNLSYNQIGAKGASALARSLKQNTKLTLLNLESNGFIALEKIIAIQKGLNRNETFTKYNGIGDEGVRALTVSLKQNTTVTVLYLQHNRIGYEGARALAESLKLDTTVTTLYLQYNGIGDEGACALAEFLKWNTAVTTLYLQSNGIGREGARALSESLKQNTTVTTMNLDYNAIGNEGSYALAESLKQNTIVASLNLQDNGISDKGARALADSIMMQNTTVTTLNVQDNRIRAKSLSVITKVLERNAFFSKSKSSLNASSQLQLAHIIYAIQNSDITVMSKFKTGFPSDNEKLMESLKMLQIAELAPCMTWIPYHEFTLVEKLGEGGFGIVYKAQVNDNRRGERFVALKMMKGSHYVIDKLRNEILVNTYLRLCSNSHRVATPAVIGISMNDNTGCYILVMEYAAGGDLTKLLTEAPPNSWSNVWRIAIEITRRLQVIHRADLIHNDLHPGNIVLLGTANDNPMIIDVGISKTVQHFSKNGSQIYGRIEYLPPEAFETISSSTKKSDIYCLGTLLWQLTARYCPRGNAMCPPDTTSPGLREEPIPGTPTEYSDIYKRCWNTDPEMRPTVEEVLEDLEEIETDTVFEEWLYEVPEALEHLEKMRMEIPTGDSSFTFVAGSISRYHTKDELGRLSKSFSKDKYAKSIFAMEYAGEIPAIVDEIKLEPISVVDVDQDLTIFHPLPRCEFTHLPITSDVIDEIKLESTTIVDMDPDLITFNPLSHSEFSNLPTTIALKPDAVVPEYIHHPITLYLTAPILPPSYEFTNLPISTAMNLNEMVPSHIMNVVQYLNTVIRPEEVDKYLAAGMKPDDVVSNESTTFIPLPSQFHSIILDMKPDTVDDVLPNFIRSSTPESQERKILKSYFNPIRKLITKIRNK